MICGRNKCVWILGIKWVFQLYANQTITWKFGWQYIMTICQRLSAVVNRIMVFWVVKWAQLQIILAISKCSDFRWQIFPLSYDLLLKISFYIWPVVADFTLILQRKACHCSHVGCDGFVSFYSNKILLLCNKSMGRAGNLFHKQFCQPSND